MNATFLSVCRLLYHITTLILLALTFWVTLNLAAEWHRDNEMMAAMRKANLEMQVENKGLYDELVKAGDEKRALDEEVYKLKLEAKVRKELHSL